jgi:hypothetical protein
MADLLECAAVYTSPSARSGAHESSPIGLRASHHRIQLDRTDRGDRPDRLDRSAAASDVLDDRRGPLARHVSTRHVRVGAGRGRRGLCYNPF